MWSVAELAAKKARLRALVPNTPAWDDARTLEVKLSASDCPAAAGCRGAYESRIKLWEYKTGVSQKPPPTEFQQRLFDKGHRIEPIAVDFFTKHLLPRGARVKTTGIWLLPGDPRIGATPDRLIEFEDGTVVPLEVKASDSPVDVAYLPPEKKLERDLVQSSTQVHSVASPFGLLFYYLADDNWVLYENPRDDFEWKKTYSALWTFLDYVERNIRPPVLSKQQRIRERDFYYHEIASYGSTYPRTGCFSAASSGPFARATIIDKAVPARDERRAAARGGVEEAASGE